MTAAPGRRRVVVTGIGVIAAPGKTRQQFWQSLIQGKSAIGPLTLVPPGLLRFTNAAEVADFDPTEHIVEKELVFLDRFAQFAMVAAMEAVGDHPAIAGERSAVVTGTSIGGQDTMDRGFQNLYGKNITRVHPFSIPRIMASSATSAIATRWGVTGPSYSVSTACASATHAIGQAFWMVRDGITDCAITGGAEASLSLGSLKGWEAIRLVAPDTCRPFSRDRKGLIVGEGAAMMVLETLQSAQSRGAKIWGEIAGFGMSSDAHHLTQPLAEGAARAMRAALADTGIPASEIGYINAHGTGTTVNDVTETAAIHQVFGERASRIPVSATKSMHGHAIGASGALEAAATLMALDSGIIPPTANFSEADPECALDVVPNHARHVQVEWAMSNSFAFGGLNAVLVFRRWTG